LSELKSPAAKVFLSSRTRPSISVMPGVSALRDAAHPGWDAGKHIRCTDPAHLLIESLQPAALLAQYPTEATGWQATFSGRMAGHVAAFGGNALDDPVHSTGGTFE
jgi:hypothetical protein